LFILIASPQKVLVEFWCVALELFSECFSKEVCAVYVSVLAAVFIYNLGKLLRYSCCNNFGLLFHSDFFLGWFSTVNFIGKILFIRDMPTLRLKGVYKMVK